MTSTGRGAGRPTTFTPEIADQICDYVAQGMTLREACRQKDMPPEATVRRWILEDRGGIAAQYARARALLLDYWADEMVDIADDSADDFIEGKNGQTLTNHEVVNRSRLRIDTRKWLLSKLRPEQYGDLLSVNSNQTVKTVTDTPVPRDAAQSAWLEAHGTPKPES